MPFSQDDVEPEPQSNTTDKNFTCYDSWEEYHIWYHNVNLWIKCIAPIVIASFGIIGNIMVMLVLRRMTSNFNWLLFVLGINLSFTILI